MVVAQAGVKRAQARASRERRLGIIFAAPTAVVAIGVFAVPLVMAFAMSLNDWPLIGQPSFNAPENYSAVMGNELFVGSILFTVKYMAATTAGLLLVAFLVALLVQNARPGVGVFRTIYLLPAAVGLTSASLLYVALYNPDFGPLDDVLQTLGFIEGRLDVFGTHNTAFVGVLAMVLWKFSGFYMIILLTGMQAIPIEVYEAARVDGSGWWNTVRFITLPLLKRTILLVLILCVTGGLLAFEPLYVMTQGGPNNSTVTMVMAVVREAFSLFKLGSASAMAIILLGALIVVNVVQLILFRDREVRS